MSMENAKTFYEKVKVDEGLQQRIGQLAKEDPKGIGAVIIRTAKENGFDFSEEELKVFIEERAKTINSNGELNDSELESVAGGKLIHWIILSIGTFGLYCAASGIDNAVHNNCTLDDENPKL